MSLLCEVSLTPSRHRKVINGQRVQYSARVNHYGTECDQQLHGSRIAVPTCLIMVSKELTRGLRWVLLIIVIGLHGCDPGLRERKAVSLSGRRTVIRGMTAGPEWRPQLRHNTSPRAFGAIGQ